MNSFKHIQHLAHLDQRPVAGWRVVAERLRLLLPESEHAVALSRRGGRDRATRYARVTRSPQTRRWRKAAEGFENASNRQAGESAETAVTRAYLVALSRPPAPAERDRMLAFWQQQRNRSATTRKPATGRWSRCARC